MTDRATRRVSLWKWVGLAGLAGVAATGAVVARDQRRRTQMSPDAVRRRLHERLEELDRAGGDRAPAPRAPRGH